MKRKLRNLPQEEPIQLVDIETEDSELHYVIQKFIELDKKKAEYKEFLDEYDDTIQTIFNLGGGVGFHFQDLDGTVYETDTMEWKSVKMTPFQIKRTRREGETKGTLSLTKARELGYKVEEKEESHGL